MRTLSGKLVLFLGFYLAGCSASEDFPTGGTGGASPNTGGTTPTGGFTATGGTASGGTPSTGGVTTGGVLTTGGFNSTGGSVQATGGTSQTTGGMTGKGNTGGFSTTGGFQSSGGKSGTGGFATGGSSMGGKAGTGGSSAGGKASSGGSSTGGKASTGGSSTGGAGAGGSSNVNCSASPLSGGSAHCSSNLSGSVNGLTWTIWSSGSGGCLYTYGVGGAFKATWNNSGDFLSRVGLQWNETKTYDQYGTISADFAYTKTGTAGGYSYIGMYGWSNNPLVEYYIVEDWFGNGPPTGGGTLKGTFNVDGGTYKVYTHTQTNQPSIHGTATFPQYFSVRQTARQCGHISLTEHFKQWASMGLNLGKMYEAKILIEAGGGVGSIDFTTANVTAQ